MFLNNVSSDLAVAQTLLDLAAVLAPKLSSEEFAGDHAHIMVAASDIATAIEHWYCNGERPKFPMLSVLRRSICTLETTLVTISGQLAAGKTSDIAPRLTLWRDGGILIKGLIHKWCLANQHWPTEEPDHLYIRAVVCASHQTRTFAIMDTSLALLLDHIQVNAKVWSADLTTDLMQKIVASLWESIRPSDQEWQNLRLTELIWKVWEAVPHHTRVIEDTIASYLVRPLSVTEHASYHLQLERFGVFWRCSDTLHKTQIAFISHICNFIHTLKDPLFNRSCVDWICFPRTLYRRITDSMLYMLLDSRIIRRKCYDTVLNGIDVSHWEYAQPTDDERILYVLESLEYLSDYVGKHLVQQYIMDEVVHPEIVQRWSFTRQNLQSSIPYQPELHTVKEKLTYFELMVGMLLAYVQSEVPVSAPTLTHLRNEEIQEKSIYLLQHLATHSSLAQVNGFLACLLRKLAFYVSHAIITPQPALLRLIGLLYANRALNDDHQHAKWKQFETHLRLLTFSDSNAPIPISGAMKPDHMLRRASGTSKTSLGEDENIPKTETTTSTLERILLHAFTSPSLRQLRHQYLFFLQAVMPTLGEETRTVVMPVLSRLCRQMQHRCIRLIDAFPKTIEKQPTHTTTSTSLHRRPSLENIDYSDDYDLTFYLQGVERILQYCIYDRPEREPASNSSSSDDKSDIAQSSSAIGGGIRMLTDFVSNVFTSDFSHERNARRAPDQRVRGSILARLPYILEVLRDVWKAFPFDSERGMTVHLQRVEMQVKEQISRILRRIHEAVPDEFIQSIIEVWATYNNSYTELDVS